MEGSQLSLTAMCLCLSRATYRPQAEGKQSGLNWISVNDTMCVLKVIIHLAEALKIHTAAGSRCLEVVERCCEVLLFVPVCLCLLVFLSSGVSNYRLAGCCLRGEGC